MLAIFSWFDDIAREHEDTALQFEFRLDDTAAPPLLGCDRPRRPERLRILRLWDAQKRLLPESTLDTPARLCLVDAQSMPDKSVGVTSGADRVVVG